MKRKRLMFSRIGNGHPDPNYWEWTHEIDWGRHYTLWCHAGFFDVTYINQ